MYCIYGSSAEGRTRYTSDEIIAMLDADDPEQARHIAWIREIEANGIRYSNQDADVLSGALAAARKAQDAKAAAEEPEGPAAPGVR